MTPRFECNTLFFACFELLKGEPAAGLAASAACPGASQHAQHDRWRRIHCTACLAEDPFLPPPSARAVHPRPCAACRPPPLPACLERPPLPAPSPQATTPRSPQRRAARSSRRAAHRAWGATASCQARTSLRSTARPTPTAASPATATPVSGSRQQAAAPGSGRAAEALPAWETTCTCMGHLAARWTVPCRRHRCACQAPTSRLSAVSSGACCTCPKRTTKPAAGDEPPTGEDTPPTGEDTPPEGGDDPAGAGLPAITINFKP